MARYSIAKGFEKTLPQRRSLIDLDDHTSYDVEINFRSADVSQYQLNEQPYMSHDYCFILIETTKNGFDWSRRSVFYCQN